MANGDNLPYQSLTVVPFTAITSEWGNGIGDDILALAAGTGLDDGAVADGKWRNGVAFRAYAGSNYASGTAGTIVQNNTEEYDLGNNYDDTTYRFTAPYNGIYHFDGGVHVATVGSQDAYIALYLNTTEAARGLQINLTTSNNQQHSVSSDLELAVGDTVEVRFRTPSASRTIVAGANLTRFNGHLVTRT